jgi:hypothetical protein
MLRIDLDDKIARALRRMEERRRASIERWEARRKELIEKRQQHLLQTMGVVKDLVMYRRASSVPQPHDLHDERLPFRVSSLLRPPSPPHNKSTDDTKPAPTTVVVVAPTFPPLDEQPHMINFRKFQPFSTSGELPRPPEQQRLAKAALPTTQGSEKKREERDKCS